MRVYTAPELPMIGSEDKSVFLGGSIEMDAAPQWQRDFIEKAKILPDDWIILNPRRNMWDSKWEQSISNPHFFQQVDWEMTYLNRANHKVFYFANNTISPITLLELGKYGCSWSSHVVCEDSYLRKGNVEIFCYREGIPIYKSLDEVLKVFIEQSK